MSFTSHIVPYNEGVSPNYQTEVDPIRISQVEADGVGSAKSSDDPQEVFPDTFVDMAKEADTRVDKDPPKKQKKKFPFTLNAQDEETTDEPFEEIL